MSNETTPAELDFSLVIPVYNEEANLEELIRRCLAVGEASGKSFEVVLTDDGSRDRSREILEAAAKEHPGKIVAVLLNRNYGQHSAVMAGLAQSRGEVVVTLDADLQNPPEEVPNLLAKMDEGFDVVGTRRVNRQDSTFRKFASKIVNHAAQRATGVKMTDYGCMLRAYRRSIIQAMLQCHERSTFIPILANSFARTTAEIPVEHAERPDGDSKYSLYKLIKLQFDMMTCMTTFPLRVLTFFGLAIAAMGFLLAMVIFIGRLAFGAAWAAQGVFTLFAILFIFVGAQFVGMGLLGEYIGRIYTDVRARPRYFVEKVIDGQE